MDLSAKNLLVVALKITAAYNSTKYKQHSTHKKKTALLPQAALVLFDKNNTKSVYCYFCVQHVVFITKELICSPTGVTLCCFGATGCFSVLPSNVLILFPRIERVNAKKFYVCPLFNHVLMAKRIVMAKIYLAMNGPIHFFHNNSITTNTPKKITQHPKPNTKYSNTVVFL